MDCDKDTPTTDKHPVGNFMWSVAIGSPIISFIAHHKKVHTEFVVTLICINMLLNICDNLLIGSLDWDQYQLLKLPVFIGYWLTRICVLGFYFA